MARAQKVCRGARAQDATRVSLCGQELVVRHGVTLGGHARVAALVGDRRVEDAPLAERAVSDFLDGVDVHVQRRQERADVADLGLEFGRQQAVVRGAFLDRPHAALVHTHHGHHGLSTGKRLLATSRHALKQ